MKVLFKFGDVVENGHTDSRNPQWRGIVVSESRDVVRLTDGKGKFWNSLKREHKLKKIAQLSSPLYSEWLDFFMTGHPFHAEIIYIPAIVSVLGRDELMAICPKASKAMLQMRKMFYD